MRGATSVRLNASVRHALVAILPGPNLEVVEVLGTKRASAVLAMVGCVKRKSLRPKNEMQPTSGSSKIRLDLNSSQA